jgi:hypothetical protein
MALALNYTNVSILVVTGDTAIITLRKENGCFALPSMGLPSHWFKLQYKAKVPLRYEHIKQISTERCLTLSERRKSMYGDTLTMI